MNSKITELKIPLVEVSNTKTFQMVSFFFVFGAIILVLSSFLLEIGFYRTISIIIALPMIVSPFIA